jgi:hypothetical protein
VRRPPGRLVVVTNEVQQGRAGPVGGGERRGAARARLVRRWRPTGIGAGDRE